MNRLRLFRSLTWVLFLGTAACSDEGTDPIRPGAIVGDYTLRSVNGAPLPYTVLEVQGTQILQGQLSLLPGSTYDLVLDVRDKTGDAVYLEPGTWGTFDVDSIFFRPDAEDETAWRGTVGGGILRATSAGGLQYEFQK